MPLFREHPELLLAFREGRREALERVYRRYARPVDRYLRSLARAGSVPVAAAAVADLLQDAFVKAYSPGGRQGYDGLRDYGPYLLTIARNCFIDWARARGREIPTDVGELALETADDAGETSDFCEPRVLAVLTAYVGELPAELKAVYEHRFIRGLSQQEAAASLGISRRGLRTAEARLRKGLRRALVRAGVSLVELEGVGNNTSARSPVRPQSL